MQTNGDKRAPQNMTDILEALLLVSIETQSSEMDATAIADAIFPIMNGMRDVGRDEFNASMEFVISGQILSINMNFRLKEADNG
ncbi:MAG: hypothetical protein OHK0046_47830 [Anaerolineae bacterium]